MLVNILIIAAVIERIWEHMQQVIGESRLSLQAKLCGSAVLSIGAALSFKLDLLYALGVTAQLSWTGIVLTGFALSLGSNVIHDLVSIIQAVSKAPGLSRAGKG